MNSHPRLHPVRAVLVAVALVTAAFGAKVEFESTVFDYGNADPYDRGNHHGFNHAPNVAILPDGRLLAAWFSGAYEGDVHQAILGATSADGGKTWAPAAPIVDLPRKSDFDPAFLVRGRRTWMLFTAGRWNRYPFVGLREVERREVGLDSYRLHLMHTDDAGRTWSAPAPVGPERRGFCRGNGIVLASGTLLFPVYDDAGEGKWVTSLLRSRDDGATWQWVGAVGAADGKAGGEPVIAELDGGRVLVAMRSRDGRVWFAVTRDEGTTWEQPFASDFDGAASSHALLRTKSGRVLLAYNACKPPHRTPLVLRELVDPRAFRWGESIVIAHAPAAPADAWSSQVSYPSIAETTPGTLVVVWTEIILSPQRQPGIIRAARVAW